MLQKEPARRLVNLLKIPVLLETGEASAHAAYDEFTVRYLQQAGVNVEHLKLADEGIHGNGHLQFFEKNNLEIVELLESWIFDATGRTREKNRAFSENILYIAFLDYETMGAQFQRFTSGPDDNLGPGTAPMLSDLKLRHVIYDASYEVNDHSKGFHLFLANPKRQSIKVRECSKGLA